MKRVALALLLVILPALAWGQGGRVGGVAQPPQPDSTVRDSVARARRDSIARAGTDSARRGQQKPPGDTARVDTATVNWQPPDSVMRALADRQGYDVTRFQGARVIYDANTRDLRLDAAKDQRAAVDRNGQTIVSDSTIY